MPRFVLLRHDHPFEHFDLMLEPPDAGRDGGADDRVLRTWRLPSRLPVDGEEVAVESLAAHRRAYLDYEGPTRSGRGRVERVDAGTYVLVGETGGAPFEMRRRLEFEVRGEKLAGRLVIDETAGTARYRS